MLPISPRRGSPRWPSRVAATYHCSGARPRDVVVASPVFGAVFLTWDVMDLAPAASEPRLEHDDGDKSSLLGDRL